MSAPTTVDRKEGVCENCERPIFWVTPRAADYWAHYHNDSDICSHAKGFRATPKEIS